MKTKYIAIIAAAAALLTFSGCGSVNEDSGAADSITKVEAGASNSENAAAPAAVDTAESAAESTTDESVPTLVDDDTSSAPENDDPGAIKDTSGADNEKITDNVFKTAGAEYTYDDLMAAGLANTSNGKMFCLVPNDAGAGHAYYQCYYSTTGSEWNDAGMYDETNGNNYHFALPDGRIILFNTEGPIASNVPLVSSIALADDNTVKSTSVPDFFKNQYLDDGSVLDATEDLRFFVTYNGGYNFTFSFTDMNGVIVYNVNTDLDSNTLLMAE